MCWSSQGVDLTRPTPHDNAISNQEKAARKSRPM